MLGLNVPPDGGGELTAVGALPTLPPSRDLSHLGLDLGQQVWTEEKGFSESFIVKFMISVHVNIVGISCGTDFLVKRVRLKLIGSKWV